MCRSWTLPGTFHKRPISTLLLLAVAIAACAATVALAAAAPATAATRWTLRGAGWGHGIGLSQWGAYGLAKRGKGYREILAHYYANTRIEQRGTSVVRVLLQANRSTVTFTGATRAGERNLEEDSVYKAKRSGDTVILLSDSDRRLEAYAGVLPISGGDTVRLLGRAGNGVSNGIYRGSIEIRTATAQGLNAINTLGIESYLQGVVPAESPPIWPRDALRAQAVVARAYALATNVSGKGFEQYPDTRSQVYRGFLAETASTNNAVADTRGEVVTYGGRVAVTYFFSTSGGYTENVENVFTGSDPKPWLRGVRDPYDQASPYHRWGPYTYSTSRLGAKLGSYVRGRFRGLDVLKRGVSPRIVKAVVRGSRGKVTVTGPQLRGRLGLRDSWFSLRRVTTGASRARARTSAGTREIVQIAGTVESAGSRSATGRFVRLQRERGERWEQIATVPLFAGPGESRYSFHVSDPGRYRIVAGWSRGPAVRVSP